jgi:hypothetical protein
MLTLREIYAALEDRFDFFRQSIDQAWRVSRFFETAAANTN